MEGLGDHAPGFGPVASKYTTVQRNTVSKYTTADKYTTNTVEQQTALSRSARLYLSEVLHCVYGRVPSISTASSCLFQLCTAVVVSPICTLWIGVGHMSSLECYPRIMLENFFHLLVSLQLAPNKLC